MDDILILAKCVYCGEDKEYHEMFNSGSEICKDCSNGIILYNKNFLERYCEIMGIETKIEGKINRETKISGVCLKCGDNNFCKKFRQLIKTQPLCSICTKIIRKEKVRQTNLEKYGVECTLHSEEVREKVKKTNLKRYGVEYPSQLEEVKEKIRQTNLKRYGVECPSQLEEVKEKIRQTNLERYGVECPSQSEEIKEKMKQTNLKRYGVKCSLQSQEIREKLDRQILKGME